MFPNQYECCSHQRRGYLHEFKSLKLCPLDARMQVLSLISRHQRTLQPCPPSLFSSLHNSQIQTFDSSTTGHKSGIAVPLLHLKPLGLLCKENPPLHLSTPQHASRQAPPPHRHHPHRTSRARRLRHLPVCSPPSPSPFRNPRISSPREGNVSGAHNPHPKNRVPKARDYGVL